jgi:hypothetical protein
MKSKRMKSILLIGLAILVVAGVIWGSFNAVSASAAAQVRNRSNSRSVWRKSQVMSRNRKLRRMRQPHSQTEWVFKSEIASPTAKEREKVMRVQAA